MRLNRYKLLNNIKWQKATMQFVIQLAMNPSRLINIFCLNHSPSAQIELIWNKVTSALSSLPRVKSKKKVLWVIHFETKSTFESSHSQCNQSDTRSNASSMQTRQNFLFWMPFIAKTKIEVNIAPGDEWCCLYGFWHH